MLNEKIDKSTLDNDVSSFTRLNNDILHISNYIIYFCNNKNISITNLKLQKLLYFIQARFLMENLICFNENILALPLGPVVREVYIVFRDYGYSQLRPISTEINLERIDLIDEVLNDLANEDPYELVEITRNQPPFRDAYNIAVGTIIKNESINNFFRRANGL